MNSKREEDIIIEEVINIINSNKSKALSLRNSFINLNQNMYSNKLYIQIVQFLGEFEYDLKTLIDLLNDYKKKTQINFQNKINSLCSENKKLKEELKTTKKLNINLKKIKIGKKTKENNLSKTKNKSNDDISKKNLKTKNSIERKPKPNYTNNIEEKKFSTIFYQPKENYSQINFYPNIPKRINTSKNINPNKKFFYDYDSFLINLKHKNNQKNNSNFIKYENYKTNNNRTNSREISRSDVNDSIRAQSANSKYVFRKNKIFNDEKRQKLINEIFQDENILNALRSQFGNDIEDKILNEDIDFNLLSKIEEIKNKVEKYYYNTPKNKSVQILKKYICNNEMNLKIPKRYSNKKENNSISNLIISPY